MTSLYSLYSWSSTSASYRSTSSEPGTAQTVLRLEEGDPCGWPDARDGASDDRVLLDLAEHAAVRRVAAVVAHHPEVVWLDRDGPEVRRDGAVRQGRVRGTRSA